MFCTVPHAQKATGIESLARSRLLGLDSTHLLGGRSGSGRRDLYLIVTEDADGRLFVCGCFYVRRNAKVFITCALQEVRRKLVEYLHPSVYNATGVAIFVDQCSAGQYHCGIQQSLYTLLPLFLLWQTLIGCVIVMCRNQRMQKCVS